MDDELTRLREVTVRYRWLLRAVNDERLIRELTRLMEEAQQRLREIEQGG
jgi:hypothetical protein